MDRRSCGYHPCVLLAPVDHLRAPASLGRREFPAHRTPFSTLLFSETPRGRGDPCAGMTRSGRGGAVGILSRSRLERGSFSVAHGYTAHCHTKWTDTSAVDLYVPAIPRRRAEHHMVTSMEQITPLRNNEPTRRSLPTGSCSCRPRRSVMSTVPPCPLYRAQFLSTQIAKLSEECFVVAFYCSVPVRYFMTGHEHAWYRQFIVRATPASDTHISWDLFRVLS